MKNLLSSYSKQMPSLSRDRVGVAGTGHGRSKPSFGCIDQVTSGDPYGASDRVRFMASSNKKVKTISLIAN